VIASGRKFARCWRACSRGRQAGRGGASCWAARARSSRRSSRPPPKAMRPTPAGSRHVSEPSRLTCCGTRSSLPCNRFRDEDVNEIVDTIVLPRPVRRDLQTNPGPDRPATRRTVVCASANPRLAKPFPQASVRADLAWACQEPGTPGLRLHMRLRAPARRTAAQLWLAEHDTEERHVRR
jgi:hypothetical protein